MKNRLNIFVTFVITACLVLPSSAAETPDPNDSSKYLNAVRMFLTYPVAFLDFCPRVKDPSGMSRHD